MLHINVLVRACSLKQGKDGGSFGHGWQGFSGDPPVMLRWCAGAAFGGMAMVVYTVKEASSV